MCLPNALSLLFSRVALQVIRMQSIE